jgi:protein kinase X
LSYISPIFFFFGSQHRPPFRNKDKNELYAMILECNVNYPLTFSIELVDLLRHLLVTDPVIRYTPADVRRHKCMKRINLDALLARTIKPPYIPRYTHTGDSSHFDAFPEEPIRTCDFEEYPEHFSTF